MSVKFWGKLKRFNRIFGRAFAPPYDMSINDYNDSVSSIRISNVKDNPYVRFYRAFGREEARPYDMSVNGCRESILAVRQGIARIEAQR